MKQLFPISHQFAFMLCMMAMFLLKTAGAWSQDAYYHKVQPQPGDYVERLLERYMLDGYACNKEQFLRLNDLNKDAVLELNQSYYIPVRIHQYNGKSIKSTLGLEGWEKPYRIKQYNDKIRSKGLRSKSIAKSNIIWVPYHEISNCTKYGDVVVEVETETSAQKEIESHSNVRSKADEDKERAQREANLKPVDPKVLAASSKIRGYRKFAIFGENHALVPLKDNKLRGKIYYVVSGHGGPDVGAIGRRAGEQLCEDEYAYDVSLRLAKNLLEHGALVYMITRDPNDGIRDEQYLSCDYDEYCWGNYRIPRGQKSRLFQRSDAVNKLYEMHRKQGIKDENQLTIAVHVDSRSKGTNTDVYFYHYPGSKESRNIAKAIHKKFTEKYRQYRSNGHYAGTVTGRDLHMLREPKTSSVFIELGNIRNSFDQQRIILKGNRQALANWMYEALAEHQ